jgi:hypothetical protein
MRAHARTRAHSAFHHAGRPDHIVTIHVPLEEINNNKITSTWKSPSANHAGTGPAEGSISVD